jgi:hypothetical protein
MRCGGRQSGFGRTGMRLVEGYVARVPETLRESDLVWSFDCVADSLCKAATALRMTALFYM